MVLAIIVGIGSGFFAQFTSAAQGRSRTSLRRGAERIAKARQSARAR
jgi:type IV secretory pathway TrbL component